MFTSCTLVTMLISSVCGNTWCSWGTYGDACDKNCSAHCLPRPNTNTVHCHIESGLCSSGCTAGWYGAECNKACSKNCMQNVCIQEDGTCTFGCQDGKRGYFCEENEAKPETTPVLSSTTIAAIITIGVLLVILFLTKLLVMYIRGSRKTSTADTPLHKASAEGTALNRSEVLNISTVKELI